MLHHSVFSTSKNSENRHLFEATGMCAGPAVCTETSMVFDSVFNESLYLCDSVGGKKAKCTETAIVSVTAFE